MSRVLFVQLFFLSVLSTKRGVIGVVASLAPSPEIFGTVVRHVMIQVGDCENHFRACFRMGRMVLRGTIGPARGTLTSVVCPGENGVPDSAPLLRIQTAARIAFRVFGRDWHRESTPSYTSLYGRGVSRHYPKETRVTKPDVNLRPIQLDPDVISRRWIRSTQAAGSFDFFARMG